jgi:hypothetical protein
MERGKESDIGERRRYIRYSCNIEMKAIIDFNTSVAHRTFDRLPRISFRKGETTIIKNISEKGISVQLEHFLPEGMMIRIAINNPVTPPIETDARVAWSKKLSDEEGYVLGMAFRHMRDRHRRNLERLIDFLKEIPE